MAEQGLIQGTKDYGITENKAFQSLFGPLGNLWSLWDNPLVKKAYAAEPETTQQTTSPIQLDSSVSKPTSSFSDVTAKAETQIQNGGGGNNGASEYDTVKSEMQSGKRPWDDNLLASLQKNAQSNYSSTLENIKNRLNEARKLASEKLTNAQSTRDYVMDYINKKYPDLISRTETQRTNALDDLSGQETTMQNLYDKAKAQARRRSESAALNNRMIARAGNRLGSSFYDQIVAQNQENLGSTLASSDEERLDKLATIGSERTKTNENFNNTIKDLEDQKTQAEYAAITEYKQAVSTAEALSRAGVLDFGESETAARDALNSRLSQIDTWAQNMALQAAALDKQYGTAQTNATSILDSINNTKAKLATQNTGYDTANSYNATIMGKPVDSTTNSTMSQMAMSQNKNTLDEILKRLYTA